MRLIRGNLAKFGALIEVNVYNIYRAVRISYIWDPPIGRMALYSSRSRGKQFVCFEVFYTPGESWSITTKEINKLKRGGDDGP